MPLFEYRCPKCSHTAEVLHKATENAAVYCRACKVEADVSQLMVKTLSRSNCQFKGGSPTGTETK